MFLCRIVTEILSTTTQLSVLLGPNALSMGWSALDVMQALILFPVNPYSSAFRQVVLCHPALFGGPWNSGRLLAGP